MSAKLDCYLSKRMENVFSKIVFQHTRQKFCWMSNSYISPGKNVCMDIKVIKKVFVHHTHRDLHILKQKPCENYRTFTYSLHI